MTQPPGYGPPPGHQGPPPGYQPPGYQPPPGPHPPPEYYGAPGYQGPPGGGYGFSYGPGLEAPRPGCVPLRPLGVGDILDGAFRVTRRNPRVMLGLSAGFAVVQTVLITVVVAVVSNNLAGLDTTGDNVDLGPVLANESLELATLFVTLLLGGILTGMLSLVVTQDVLGRRLGAGEVWVQVRPRLWTLVGLAFVTSILEFVGLGACLVPGIWLWGIWAVAVPACMVERTTIRGALGRSRALVSGTFWRVWGIRALGWLVLQVVSSLITIPFLTLSVAVGGGLGQLFSTDHGTPIAALLVIGVGSVIGETLTAPIRAGVDALLYVDLRMRKEGLDIVLQRASGPAAGPPLTAG